MYKRVIASCAYADILDFQRKGVKSIKIYSEYQTLVKKIQAFSKI